METKGISARRRVVFMALLAVVVVGFGALGVWQVERRTWKLALIEAVDSRAAAAAVDAPEQGPVTAADDAYRHVQAAGTWLNDRTTLVQALTARGPGWWVMTPLRTAAGWTVLVNRGFVPDHAPALPPESFGSVVGLLRITEPRGSFLQSNDPAAGRWHSRDVSAIAAARGLERVAPYFIDADATPNPGGLPVGGLTVIAFPNSHLVYALTWFSLSLMGVAGMVMVMRGVSR